MELAKVRQLNNADLAKEMTKTEHLLAELAAQVTMHKLKNHQKLRLTRRYFSRLSTVHREKTMLKDAQDTKVEISND